MPKALISDIMFEKSAGRSLYYKYYLIAEPTGKPDKFMCSGVTNWCLPPGVAIPVDVATYPGLYDRAGAERLIREFNAEIAKERASAPEHVSTRPAFVSPLFSRYERVDPS